MKELNFDYYKNSVEIFDFLKDNDWSVFLCSNYESFKNERYDIISCCPIKKILAYQNARKLEGSEKLKESQKFINFIKMNNL